MAQCISLFVGQSPGLLTARVSIDPESNLPQTTASRKGIISPAAVELVVDVSVPLQRNPIAETSVFYKKLCSPAAHSSSKVQGKFLTVIPIIFVQPAVTQVYSCPSRR